MVGFYIIVGILLFFQVVDYKDKKAKGEDTRSVLVNLFLLLVLVFARVTDRI